MLALRTKDPAIVWIKVCMLIMFDISKSIEKLYIVDDKRSPKHALQKSFPAKIKNTDY